MPSSQSLAGEFYLAAREGPARAPRQRDQPEEGFHPTLQSKRRRISSVRRSSSLRPKAGDQEIHNAPSNVRLIGWRDGSGKSAVPDKAELWLIASRAVIKSGISAYLRRQPAGRVCHHGGHRGRSSPRVMDAPQCHLLRLLRRRRAACRVVPPHCAGGAGLQPRRTGMAARRLSADARDQPVPEHLCARHAGARRLCAGAGAAVRDRPALLHRRHRLFDQLHHQHLHRHPGRGRHGAARVPGRSDHLLPAHPERLCAAQGIAARMACHGGHDAARHARILPVRQPDRSGPARLPARALGRRTDLCRRHASASACGARAEALQLPSARCWDSGRDRHCVEPRRPAGTSALRS